MDETMLQQAFWAYFSEAASYTKIKGNRYIIANDLLERTAIKHAMKRTQNNKVQAAKLVGLNRNTFRKRIEAYELEFPPYGKCHAS